MREQNNSGWSHGVRPDYEPSFGAFIRLVIHTSVGYLQQTATGLATTAASIRERPQNLKRGAQVYFKKYVLTFANFLALLWVIVLLWGEVSIFDQSVRECDWSSWEQWVCTLISSFRVRLTMNEAPRSQPSSLSPRRRSPACRPSYLSRPTLAIVFAHNLVH